MYARYIAAKYNTIVRTEKHKTHKTLAKLWNQERHPKPRPNGWAMGCLRRYIQRKVTAIYRERHVYVSGLINQAFTRTCDSNDLQPLINEYLYSALKNCFSSSRHFHYKDKTISRPYYLYDGIPMLIRRRLYRPHLLVVDSVFIWTRAND